VNSAGSAQPERGATFRLMFWCALVAGLVEGGIRLVQLNVFDQTIGMSPHVIWMAPLANLAWIGAPLLLVALVGKLFRGDTSGARYFVILLVTFVSLILIYQGLHKGVALFLATALAWQVGPRLRRSARFNSMVRRTLPAVALLPILAGLFIAGTRWKAERDLIASAPAPRPGLPNIILIIWDTVRGQNLSLYGYERRTTPFLAELAREGVRFDLALATAPWTLPSHGSMFTGRWPNELKSRLRIPLTDSFPRIAEALAAEGYATGGFVANLAYCSREHGLHRGFQRYEDYQISAGRILLASRLGRVMQEIPQVRRLLGYYELPGRKTAEDVNEGFLRWSADQTSRPFFAFLNYFDGHQPYLPPEPFRSRFSATPGERYRPTMVETRFGDVTENELRWSLEQYDGAIAYLDSALADLKADLEARGQLDNTVIVVTSDHGEHFGEHQKLSHANSLYRQLLQVPLVIWFPSRVSASVVAQPVSLRDLPRTLLDLAGVKDRWGFPGSSLARHWTASDSGSQQHPGIFSEMYSVSGPRAYSMVAEGYHLAKWFSRPGELYHLDDDPREERNLASTVEGAAIKTRLERMAEEYTRTNPRENSSE
jgi:arylsulfatase A-like enzyme